MLAFQTPRPESKEIDQIYLQNEMLQSVNKQIQIEILPCNQTKLPDGESCASA